ncbi:MAG: tetratricopeptide repeat protein [Bacillota bacterium]
MSVPSISGNVPFSGGPQGRVHHHLPHSTILSWISLSLALFLSLPAHADQLVVNNLTYNDVRITAVRDGEVFFTIAASGNETHKPLVHVSKIALSDEPAFNAAEEAYATKQWDRATENYEKTLRTTQKPWLKDWVSLRLLESASQGGRFDAAIQAYIVLAEKSPDSVRAVKLLMPKPDSAYLKEAIKQVNAAIDRNNKAPVKDVLFNLLVELHKVRNDLKAANETLTRQMQLKAADPSTPEGARAAVALKLNAIRLALQAKEYAKVIQLIEKDSSAFVEPADQAEALFDLAEAKAGLLGSSKDVAAWKDVALAYMRVAANCSASLPQVPAALLKTAAIYESPLAEKETALRIYEQIATEYKGQPIAKDAEKAIQHLRQ